MLLAGWQQLSLNTLASGALSWFADFQLVAAVR
jgi:hypothetical protein